MEKQIFDILLQKSQSKGNIDFFKDEIPSYGLMHTEIRKELSKYLDDIGIPYSVFKLENSKNDLIIFNQKNIENVIEIEKGTRIRIGLEIQSKEDLKMAVYENNKLTGKHEQLETINGLTEYEAARISDLMNKNGFPAVMKMYPDFTYEVSCHQKRKNKLQQFLLQAVFEEFQFPEKVKFAEKLFLQKNNLNRLLAEVEQDELRQPQYIISASEPDIYIKVEPDKFTYFDASGERFSQPNTETFSERLSLCTSIIDYPIVVEEYVFRQIYSFNSKSVAEEMKEAVSFIRNSALNQAASSKLFAMSKVDEEIIQISDADKSLFQEFGLQIENPEALLHAINERLKDCSVYPENAGVTLEYMVNSEYGYNLEETIKIAQGKYIDYEQEEDVTIPSNEDTEQSTIYVNNKEKERDGGER